MFVVASVDASFLRSLSVVGAARGFIHYASYFFNVTLLR